MKIELDRILILYSIELPIKRNTILPNIYLALVLLIDFMIFSLLDFFRNLLPITTHQYFSVLALFEKDIIILKPYKIDN